MENGRIQVLPQIQAILMKEVGKLSSLTEETVMLKNRITKIAECIAEIGKEDGGESPRHSSKVIPFPAHNGAFREKIPPAFLPRRGNRGARRTMKNPFPVLSARVAHRSPTP